MTIKLVKADEDFELDDLVRDDIPYGDFITRTELDAKWLDEYGFANVAIISSTGIKAVCERDNHLDNLLRGFEEGLGNDYALIAGGKSFKMPKFIMMAQSSVLKEMILSGLQD